MIDSPYKPTDDVARSWEPASVDSGTVAILTKFNELAERYGIRHSDFVATVKDGEDRLALVADWMPTHPHPDLNEERFDRMLRTAGFPENSTVLTGLHYEIIEALDRALQRAPKQTGR